MHLAEAELLAGVDCGLEERRALPHPPFEEHFALEAIDVNTGLCPPQWLLIVQASRSRQIIFSCTHRQFRMGCASRELLLLPHQFSTCCTLKVVNKNCWLLPLRVADLVPGCRLISSLFLALEPGAWRRREFALICDAPPLKGCIHSHISCISEVGESRPRNIKAIASYLIFTATGS